MAARGVVAAGHPLTAEAGAQVLRDGGNAVDAAVAAVMTSFVAESPLTGFGAGGYMLVHMGEAEELLDFFVAVPGLGGHERRSELMPVPVAFTPEAIQTFHVGPASCAVPGVPAGIEAALERWGSVSLAELAAPAARLAREGVEADETWAYFYRLLEPILTADAPGRAVYAPEGSILRAGERFRFPDLADALERFGAEGSEPFYRGEVASALAEAVLERGGALGPDDLAAYEPHLREPIPVRFGGRRVLTNPPPSSGGILIAFVLGVLERAGDTGLEALVRAMDEAQAARTEDFAAGLGRDGFTTEFLADDRLAEAAARVRAGERPPPSGPQPGDRLGSTTHITALDADGGCASVTCSNGSGSGVIVPGTGIHLNNMLGEQDLNPHGFHRHPAGVRMPSMMSPTIVTRSGDVELGLGSGGSNRIRSAVSQTVLRMVADGLGVAAAVDAPRVHFEDGVVEVEPGCDAAALEALEAAGYGVARWAERNLYFGGVHAVARDPDTGECHGAGDARRGGAVAYA